MRALWATFILNTVFTVAQLIGSRAANSLALMSDTSTMAIDSLTYAINVAAEYYKERMGARQSAIIEIVASIVSVVFLVAVTANFLSDAINRLNADAEEVEEEVNPIIMLVFTSINLVIDFAMCASIVLRRTGGIAGCLMARCCCARAERA